MTPVMLEMYVSVTYNMGPFFFSLLFILFCHSKLPHSSLWLHVLEKIFFNKDYQLVACESTNYFLAITKSDGSNY